MWTNTYENADLLIFTKEILNGKLHFSCSDMSVHVIPWIKSYFTLEPLQEELNLRKINFNYQWN